MRNLRTSTLRFLVLALLALALLNPGSVGAAANAGPVTNPIAQDSPVIWRVVPGGSGNHTGESWDDAMDLQEALTAAQPGTEIWVKEGAYKPNEGEICLGTDITFAVKTHNDHFVTAVDAGGRTSDALHTDTENIGPWEKFRLEPVDDGRYAIQTSGGYYITAVSAGGRTFDALHTDTKSIGQWEKFRLEPVDDGRYTIQTSDDYYVTATEGGGQGNTAESDALQTNRTKSGPWEKFRLVPITFQLKNDIALYGGFAGDETSRDERNWRENTTILSGDLNGDDSANWNQRDDNSFHVVTASNTDGSAVLDGFTITGGTASGAFPDNDGGGMLMHDGSPTLANLIFRDNRADGWGGGLFARDGSAPRLTNVTFNANSADYGGGMGSYINSAAILTDVTFEDNSAKHGGGMGSYDSSPTLSNTTFSNNAVFDSGYIFRGGDGYGGGMYNLGGSPSLENVTFSKNKANGGNAQRGDGGHGYGGGIYSADGSLTLANVTFHNNSAEGGSGNAGGNGYGGGAYLKSDDRLKLTNVTFSHNTALGGQGSGSLGGGSGTGGNAFGGGIYSSGSPTLKNITAFTNSARGGVNNSGESNEGSGGGIYSDNGNATVISSILWGNTASTKGDQIFEDPKGPVTVSYSDVKMPDNKVWPGSSNINSVPLLDPLQDNGGSTWTHALQRNSPAIDAGNPVNCPNTDQRGATRKPYAAGDDIGGCDMGAFELQYVAKGTPSTIKDEYVGFTDICSLRELIETFNRRKDFGGCLFNTALTLEAETYKLTIPGEGEDNNATGDLDIRADLIIQGAGRENTVIDAAGLDRVLDIAEGVTVELHDLTLQGGSTEENGGGILNKGELTISNSTLAQNSASEGGGIRNTGALTVTNSTLSANTAQWGGGIHNAKDKSITLERVTVHDNTAELGGGGIFSEGKLTITNSTVGRNRAGENGGGGIHNGKNGTVTANFSTIYANQANVGANIYNGNEFNLFANIVANPIRGLNCSQHLTSDGYNRVSDDSCGLSDDEVKGNAAIQLRELALNQGETPNYLPVRSAENSILDVVPVKGSDSCEFFLGAEPVDQRGKPRPLRGLKGKTPLCDVGAVEAGLEVLYVCGPPLATDPDEADRCEYPSVADALGQAVDGDSIAVSGIVTERITVTKDLTLRGPSLAEATPGTHMGFLQAAAQPPLDGSSGSGPVVTIADGAKVIIRDLHIRNGNGEEAGGLHNSGDVMLSGVTLYDNRASDSGGAAIWNAGTLTLTNSTVTQNGGKASIYNTSTSTTMHIGFSTLSSNHGFALWNEDQTTIISSIISATQVLTGDGRTTFKGYNLVSNDSQDLLEETGTQVGDAQLGPLRDNGGPTLTLAPAAGSPAENGPAACGANGFDQRGRARPMADSAIDNADRCTIGAVQNSTQRFTVCENCNAEPDKGQYTDLQEALNRSMAGDTIAIQAGAYTGNYIIYKDVTLAHAGIDVALLNRADPIDVRAILQASPLSIREQRAQSDPSDSVLRIHAYAPSAAAIEPSGDISVTLRGLTIRHGMSRQGGGIHNLGRLNIIGSTINDNAAVNGYDADDNVIDGQEAGGGAVYNAGQLHIHRSTLSSNRSEYHGGAIFNDGARRGADGEMLGAGVEINASTLAGNFAARIGEQHMLLIDNDLVEGGPPQFMQPITSTLSGDEILVQNRLPFEIVLNVSGGSCNRAQIVAPPSTLTTEPLICTAETVSNTVTIASAQYENLTTDIIVNTLNFTPTAHIIYQFGQSTTYAQFSQSLLVSHASSTANCGRDGTAVLSSTGYNLSDDESCALDKSTDLTPTIDSIPNPNYRNPGLGPLQDNNWVDFETKRISGYTHVHALMPGSPAIDQIPSQKCSAVRQVELNVVDGQTVATDANEPSDTIGINAGDVIVWFSNDKAVTVVLYDGDHNVRLIPIPDGGRSRQVQFNEPGSHAYRIYDDATRQGLSEAVITVQKRAVETDQRGMALPQRGTEQRYSCDIGAYEFQPFVVGEFILRPPTAVGSSPPSWEIAGQSLEGSNPAYHIWSPATTRDYPLHPTTNNQDGDLLDKEMVTLVWTTNADPRARTTMQQIGIVEWPDDPQLHIAGAQVNLNHLEVNDEFLVSDARAFEGRSPEDEAAGTILSSGIFTRSLLVDLPGESYSVLSSVKNAQSNATARVLVVRSVDWNTPGIRDARAPGQVEATACTIGKPLHYTFFSAAEQTLEHEDPEGRSGSILDGDAYDGVRTEAELAVVQNTVDGLAPPAYVRETRQGPIIPILETAPTVVNSVPVTGSHDLRVAWYRPDARNVAWPVKSVGYRCAWPNDPPQIVIASELGSEIDSQPVLNADRYADVTVYHQPDKTQPGYSPNWEHALLTSSNLGNPAPALYALRTDLKDRNADADQSYSLLKYRDPQQGNQIVVDVYSVVLTRIAETIADSLDLRVGDGAVNISAGDRATVPVDVLGARNLHTAEVRIAYDPNEVQPVDCQPNRLDFVEAPAGLKVWTPEQARPLRVVHMRADLAAGSDVQYEWNFGDGTTRIAGSEVSTVYGDREPVTYTVAVTATSGLFAPITGSAQLYVAEDVAPGSLPDKETTGCRLEGNEIFVDLTARNKHGESGDLALAELTFEPVSEEISGTLVLSATSIFTGPAYTDLRYNVIAGNPIYAPTPLRGLLDIQPCDETSAYQSQSAAPFWKDFKGKLWARAAGEMAVLYFYPLQPGFHLNVALATELGLVEVNADGNPTVLSADQQVGRCIPWLHQSTATRLYADFPVDGKNTRVLPVTYQAQWPALTPVLTVGETVFERPKSGISGVAEQLAVAKVYDDMAPGKWIEDDTQAKIVISGAATIKSLAQLIDPMSEVRVHLDLKINDNWSLPAEIETTRLLFGGGQAIVGVAGKPDLRLPFALRSRITFDDINGDLVFKGYYDGASPQYMKGDPLLLLNVMSESDKARLQRLCAGGGDTYPFAQTDDCGKYKNAIEDLYHKSRNPRQVDLCRSPDGKLNESGSEDATHLDRDDDKDKTSLEKRIVGRTKKNPDFDYAQYNGACQGGTYRDLLADHDFLISVQDANNDGISEAYEGLGKGKALSAGNAAGAGYITLAYNNDPSVGDLPVSLQVIQVGCTRNHLGEDSTYRGNLLVVESDNLFDERLTLRHTGDFGGRPDNFEFDWYIAAVDDTGVSPGSLPPAYPWVKWTKLEPGATDIGPELTIEGANVTTLRDNWLLLRYKGYQACGNQYVYSAYAGDPSAKPSEVRAQFAPGWIKRVTTALNPFDARVDDFVSAPVNATVDMISQAGPRYEGPIPFSNDPETLNGIGLIEAYQTVLERGRDLSIDSNINDQGANAALLNVTTRLADLYLLLANDAYMDALDPTIGLGSESDLGVRAPAIFAFLNQFRPDSFGLIDEELALLRGRDETLGGVATGPTYNRLTWNFTNGEGEVAYVMNYNVQDMNRDGFVDEADAAIRYPQGHGDAWGHYLTALQKYYELLRHRSYTWAPRAEPLGVAGAPVVVDYYDERRFAIAAAAKARLGAEIVDLTYRKHYADADSQPYVDDNPRAWGVDDWARRTGQGAYLDWLVANAILPAEDNRYQDVRKIDRTTVTEVEEIADHYLAVQAQLDDADAGFNPLGLADDVVLFDLDPARSAAGETHFEQVYARANASLANALKLFEYANQMKVAQREAQAEHRDFVDSIVDQDRALNNELIELFGYPYDADIGVNGTYPEGYEGPDIYNYDLWDRVELTDAEARCSENEVNRELCASETKTYLVGFNSIPCIGFFPMPLHSTQSTDSGNPACYRMGKSDPVTLTIEYQIGIGLDAGRGRYKPASWPEYSARMAPGEIQNALQALNQARIEYEQAIQAYQNHLETLHSMKTALQERIDVLAEKRELKVGQNAASKALDTVLLVAKEIVLWSKLGEDAVKETIEGTSTCPPSVNGFSNDFGSPIVCALKLSVTPATAGFDALQATMTTLEHRTELAKIWSEFGVELRLDDIDDNAEIRQLEREWSGVLREERELRLALFLAKDKVNGAQGDYDQALQRGFRKLKELSRLRQRWAGQITEQRYNDMAYRVFENDALRKYRQQFDLAQQYVYLAAAAYDYETNLAGNDPASGEQFLHQIVGQRSLGEVRWTTGPWDVEPIVGSGGLAEMLGRMRDNFAVLKGQLGFNNPQYEANRFSLRREQFGLDSDVETDAWTEKLRACYSEDIYSDQQVARLAKPPYGASTPQPGLVIPFKTAIVEGQNFFGQPLGPGDSSYDASRFTTKIASAGIWFKGYNENSEQLANTPRVYLIPVGQDMMRPRNTQGEIRTWTVAEQMLPVPYPIGPTEMQNPVWNPRRDGLSGPLFAVKPYARLRAYPYDPAFDPSEMNTDTRLIGRSAWNTQWLLIIPGSSLLADPQEGIERFWEDVEDIYIYFQTYSYAGG